MADESVFFQSGDIMVTNARFIVGAQTFAMSGITSVHGVETPAGYAVSVTLILLGLLLTLTLVVGGFGAGILGLLMLAFGIWLAVRRKTTFAVVLRTAGGEVTAYQSADREHIAQVIRALNDSIVSRG